MKHARVLIVDVGGRLDPLPTSIAQAIDLLSKNHSLIVSFKRFNAPADSVNMSFKDWRAIANLIYERYETYDGFVVWHGIDTLAYCSSALSFMFENLTKPVVITGCQRPSFAIRTDAVINLVSAIEVAAHKLFDIPLIPEVVVCFNGVLLRGNRTRAVSSSSFHAFDSPNYPALGQITDRIQVNERLLRELPHHEKRIAINNLTGESIVNIAVFPGIDGRILDSILEDNVKGLILQTYGNGNIPESGNFIASLRRAIDRGIFVVVINNTMQGAVELGLYESSASLAKIGIVSGGDMTPEAALAKLSLTLGRGLTLASTREIWDYDLRGERSDTKGHIEGLWIPQHDLQSTIQVIGDVNKELILYLARHPKAMHGMAPRAFEVLVAEVFRHHGFDIELTPETRDGGYDLRAIFVDGLGIKCLSLVEAKKYAPDNPVGVSVVRNLYGVVASENAARGIIVTTSRFTRDAREFQSANLDRLSLHDYEDM